MEKSIRDGIIQKLNNPTNKKIELSLEELTAIAKQYIHVEGNHNVQGIFVDNDLTDIKAAFVLA